jgi:tripeptidyl-peptidase-1
MLFTRLSALTAIATTCLARPTSSVVVEKLDSAPVGWVKDGSSAALDKEATTITLKIHMVNRDMAKFHELAMNVRHSFLLAPMMCVEYGTMGMNGRMKEANQW